MITELQDSKESLALKEKLEPRVPMVRWVPWEKRARGDSEETPDHRELLDPLERGELQAAEDSQVATVFLVRREPKVSAEAPGLLA